MSSPRAGTRSSRPGTPGQAAIPATASSSPTPDSTSATTAPSALATLNTPASPTDTSASTPPGPMTRKVLPSAPDRTSTARQSASPFPAAENVVIGTSADDASRRPYLSSTLMTPRSVLTRGDDPPKPPRKGSGGMNRDPFGQ